MDITIISWRTVNWLAIGHEVLANHFAKNELDFIFGALHGSQWLLLVSRSKTNSYGYGICHLDGHWGLGSLAVWCVAI